MAVFESPFGDIRTSDLSITERVFEGMQNRDAVTLIDGVTAREWTAGELADSVKSFAGGLAERGFGKGHVIALMAPNIPEFFTIFHGAAWAGATVTTVNPTYTAHELQYQLNDAGADLLVTVPAFVETATAGVEGTKVKEIVVIGEAEGAVPLSEYMGAPLAAQAPVDVAEDVVALPYSSGTTGLPKGVMLTHRNLVVNLDQIMPVGRIEPGEVTPAFLPFFHIYGLEVLLNLYLAAGARLVTMPRFDLEQFLRHVQEHRAKKLWIVPPVAIALAKHPMIDQFDLSSVEQVNSAAAPLGADLAEAVGKRLGCHATQAYGMTEMSPASHVTPLPDARAGSVGQTVPGTRCRIVDSETGADLGPGGGGRALGSGSAGDEGLPEQPRRHGEDPDRGRLAEDRRRRDVRRGRVPLHPRPREGTYQIQGVPGRPGGARGRDPDASRRGGRRRDRHSRPGGGGGADGLPGSRAGCVPDRGRDRRASLGPRRALQAGPQIRLRRRDPEIGLRQDPAACPPRSGGGGLTPRFRVYPTARSRVTHWTAREGA